MSDIVDKNRILGYASGEDEKILLAKAYDSYVFFEKTGREKFSGFMSPSDRALIESAFRKALPLTFFGGYGEAERTIFSFGEVEHEAFPISVLLAEGNFRDISHRDFLGSLMSLGITRENVGDIVKKDDCCYIFVLNSMAEYIRENLSSVKWERLKNSLLPFGDVTVEKEFEIVKKSVASLRADAVIAAVFNLSRSDAAESIRRGGVNLNHRPLDSLDKKLSEGDTLSLRGRGKAELSALGDYSKKGRLFIEIKKYK